MSEKIYRQFKEGQHIYVIDDCFKNNKTQIIITSAEIIRVENDIFRAYLRDDIYQEYNTKDYGRLIFDSEVEAKEGIKRLPRKNTILYKINEDYTISKSKVKNFWFGYFNKVIDFIVQLKNGENIATSRIGVDVFLSKKSAKKQAKILRNQAKYL